MDDLGILATRRRTMSGRGADGHRTASPLELFFDLAFVVAIAFAAANLHHEIVDHHYLDGAINFATSFFAIWWAWVNYTWFASAYDTDDIPFRLLTMVQMVGVIVLAIGIAESHGGLGVGQVVGYVIMRLALVVQWLRAMREDARHHDTCRRYAIGIMLMQAYWTVAIIVLPEQWLLVGMVIGIIGEMNVPWIAERAGTTPWHPHHIAERHGLFVIIVLGEGVLGMTNALASAIDALGWTESLFIVAPASIALLLGIWWAYFLAPYGDRLAEAPGKSFGWGYGHYFLFAPLAALGAGLEVAETAIEHPEDVTATVAAAAIAIPIAAFLVAKYVIHNYMWQRDPWYDRLTALAFVLLGGVVLVARAGLDVQFVIASFVIVPLTLIIATEGRVRALTSDVAAEQ